MSKIYELIKEKCQNGVEYRKLEDCCTVLDKKRKPVTKAAREAGEYPYYGANGIQDYVSDYIFDGTFILVGEDGSVITKAGTPVVTWAKGKIWVNNHAHIIEGTDDVLLRYLFHYVQTIGVTPLIHGNIPKLTGRDFRALQIPVPPLEVQREIVKTLDNFTELKAELETELIKRKQQYEHYRDHLLSFENITSRGGQVEWLPLKELCKVNRGKRVVRSQLSKNKKDGFPVYQNSLKPLGYFNEYNCEAKKAFVICAGAAGEIGYSEVNFWAADDCSYFTCDSKISERYLYHVLMNNHNYLSSKVRRSSIPRLSKELIENIKVPVPTKDIQARIVYVLDNFDAVCHDLNIGLPAEIKARQKQYEYYRDRLLSFDAVVSGTEGGG